MQAGLVGRRQDVDRLVTSLLDSSPGAVAVEIVGEPGIGKTALLDAILAEVGAAAIARISATAVEQPLTWTGLAQLVDTWPASDVAELAPAQHRALDAAIGLDDEPVEPGLVAAAVAALFQAATERGPAVVAVDDAHWIDDATAGVVTYALRANRNQTLRLLLARRPVPTPIEPSRVLAGGAVRAVTLDGLSMAGVHELLAGADVQLGRPQLVHVHEVTGGNPLHVLELARLLAAGQALDEALRRTSVESMIGQRVGSLSPSARTVLGLAALTAAPRLDVLTACVDDVDVSDALAEAERAGVVTVVASTVRFTHPTVGAAADAALGAIDRARLHRRLAEVVDGDERALHLDAAAEAHDESVATALDEAARDAWDRGATEAAAQRMTRAIERTPVATSDARWERRIALANMLLDLGAGRDALASIDADVESAAPVDPALAARVARTRATCRFHANDEVAAAGELAALVDAFAPGHPTRVDALLAQARMTVFFDVAASVAVADQAAEEAHATGDQDLIDTTSACALSCRFLAGEPVALHDTDAVGTRRLSAPEIIDEVLLWNDDLDRAEPRIVERVADAERRGDLATVANISLQAAEARMRRGDPAGARDRYQRVLEVASMMDDRAWIAVCHASLALTGAHLGDRETAHGHLEVARRSVDELSPADRLAVQSSIGTAAVVVGDSATAVAQLRLAREVTHQLRLHDCNALPFRAQMVEALLAVGELDEAREVAEELMRFATNAGRTRGIGDAHRAAALLHVADGDLDAARDSIEAAIAAHDQLPGPLEGAWSRLVAGVIERRARKRSLARAYFEQARDVSRAAGAEALAQRADTEFTRTAGRPAAGIAELTASEEQVARLVALGHTNAEVAAQLHMSAKTVESNLTRIYRKLGVRSRTELAARAPT